MGLKARLETATKSRDSITSGSCPDSCCPDTVLVANCSVSSFPIAIGRFAVAKLVILQEPRLRTQKRQ